jgi:hypothetical protein
VTGEREREWCAVCQDKTVHGVFQQNGFAFDACKRCGDAGAIPKEEAS